MDAIVIGSGPNGLTAAATLARRGWKVLVLEAQNRPGGACYSVEGTLPGYVHDVGAAFFPFADDSPAFRDLDLTGAGLRWVNAPRESCHPAPDGSSVAISRDPEQSAISFGEDGPAWRRLALWRRAMGDRLTAALLGPLPGFGAALRLGPYHLAWLMREGLGTTASFALRHFKTEAARRVVPALALHVDLGPDDLAGAGLGLVLALLASGPGFRIPVGGARSIAHALIRRLEEAGGAVRLNARAERIVVRGGRAVGGAGGRAATRSRWAGPYWPTWGRRRWFTDCWRTARRRACAGGCAGSATAGARSRWTGRCPAPCRGPRRRPASRPWSTPATASPTCGPSRARSAPAIYRTIPTW